MDLVRSASRRSKRASASSASATSACRWPSSSRAPGFHVVGFDVAEDKVEALNAGRATFPTFRPNTSPKSSRAVRSSRRPIRRALADVDIIDICVPTPLRKTRDPDLSYVVQAVETTANVIRKGQLVILESTTYPGTTDEVVQPALEAKRAQRGQGLLSRVFAGARRSGQSAATRRRTSRRSSAASTRRAPTRRSRSTAR